MAKGVPPVVASASGSVVANGWNLPHTLLEQNWQKQMERPESEISSTPERLLLRKDAIVALLQ